jgi:hypothetical protein
MMKKKKKKMGVVAFVASLMMVLPAVAQLGPGWTEQTWDFNVQIGGPLGILPSQVENPFGTPDASVRDMLLPRDQDLSWNPGGYWQGSEFKIVLDIPNQPIANPEKLLWITLTYRGDVSFLWIADIDTGELFNPVADAVVTPDPTSGWTTLTQQWFFKPNPREEIVAIGLRGDAGALAAIDSIYIKTWCVPEPATIAIFGLGAALMLRLRKKA